MPSRTITADEIAIIARALADRQVVVSVGDINDRIVAQWVTLCELTDFFENLRGHDYTLALVEPIEAP